jgi:DNA replication protein DnaC
MLQNNTLEKLQEMRLDAMAKSFQEQMKNRAAADLSFDDRFAMLVDDEWTARRNNLRDRLKRRANFEWPNASIEDIDWREDRKLDKALIARLATCRFMEEYHNIILMGATGSGKSYLACAFGNKAIQDFNTVRYVRLPELLADLALARAEGKYAKVLAQYKKVKLLILDEWLLFKLKETEARDLLEIAEARYKQAPTIFCSQFDVGGWHQKIGESTLADAVCDRIVYDSYTIVISGKESMRKIKGLKTQG